MSLSEVLVHYWHIVLGAVLGLTWLVRLEMRSVQNTKNHERDFLELKREIKDLETRLVSQRNEDVETRKENSQKLDATLDIIQSDIKELLQRTARN